MSIYRISVIISALMFSLNLLAGPAMNGPVTLTQPDGSRFTAFLKGDEFTRIKMTADGKAIIQDRDGWWCYAIYDTDGGKCSSGWKVGNDVPHEILVSSSYIPYAALSATAENIRMKSAGIKGSLEIKEMPGMIKAATKSEGQDDEVPVKRGLVILAEFSDVSFKYPKSNFENLLNKEGYTLNGATGSAKQYFDDQFDGKAEFEFHVSEIVKLPKKRSYYGGNDAYGNDRYPAEMVAYACTLADSEIDFSLYDDDSDGEVDNVFVFFAGADEAEGADEDCIWSHAWYIKDGAGISLTLDGKVINRYACTSELTRSYNSAGQVAEYMTSIGTFCHEYSHTLGLPDFYDTDYDDEGGWAAGLWKTSIMDSGNYNNGGNTPPNFNAIERMILGISTPEQLTQTGRYSLTPIDKDNRSFRIDADRDGEYFLFECRAKQGWDKYIGGSGMLVYHIDRTDQVISKWTYENTVNAEHSHQCADLIEADSRKDSFSSTEEQASLFKNTSGIFFPYNDIAEFKADGTPAFRFWSGAESGLSLVSIKEDDSGISFSLIEKGAAEVPPEAVNISYEAFADAAIIQFESSYPYEGTASIRWGRKDNEDQELELSPYSSGKYSLTLEGLESSKTYGVEIIFINEGIEGKTGSLAFMTKRMSDVDWPYIYMGSTERAEDGTFKSGSRFPMRVYNASDAAEVIWTFNGKKISPEGDGYWTISEDGTLMVTVKWEDGRTEVMSKEIKTSR